MAEYIVFNGINSNTFGLMIGREGQQSKSLVPDFEDIAETTQGYDGQYYFGSNTLSKSFSVYFVAERITSKDLQGISKWLSTKNICQFYSSATPYKYINCKIASPPQFEYVSFWDSTLNTYLYSGTINVAFIAYDPYSYSFVQTVPNYTSYGIYNNIWYYDSGILLPSETPATAFSTITQKLNFKLYNAGSGIAKPVIKLRGTATSITVQNLTTNQQFTLNNLPSINNDFIVDCEKGNVRVVDTLSNSYHTGGFITLVGSSGVERHNAIVTYGSKTITLSAGDKWGLDIAGRYIGFSGTYYKVQTRNSDLEITLIENFIQTSGKKNACIVDLNELSITGVNMNLSSISFEYKHTYI